MDLQQILLICGGSLFGLFTLIEITPIKINPWSAIAKTLGNAFNSGLITKIEVLEQQVNDCFKEIEMLRHKFDKHNAENKRRNILQFEKQLLEGDKKITKEAFDTILLDITSYEDYCNRHPEFKNNVVKNGIYFINKIYQKKLTENSFYIYNLEEKEK